MANLLDLIKALSPKPVPKEIHIQIFWQAMIVRQDLRSPHLVRLANAFREQGYKDQAKRLIEESNRRYILEELAAEGVDSCLP
jgi:hypothetical protein